MPGNLQLFMMLLGAGLLIWNISCLAQGKVPFARASNIIRRSEQPSKFLAVMAFQTTASVALLVFGLFGVIARN